MESDGRRSGRKKTSARRLAVAIQDKNDLIDRLNLKQCRGLFPDANGEGIANPTIVRRPRLSHSTIANTGSSPRLPMSFPRKRESRARPISTLHAPMGHAPCHLYEAFHRLVRRWESFRGDVSRSTVFQFSIAIENGPGLCYAVLGGGGTAPYAIADEGAFRAGARLCDRQHIWMMPWLSDM